ncbi:hydrogenase nickel insertion protein HypA [Burkholderiales bacterium GJ-E10]|nr:hydrogenase nickel insertion protein HypA [Burkholderiales bacterium GJ-E10]
MHEMSLAHGVLQILEDAAAREGFSRVKTVWLEIGALAAVEPDSLSFCFDVVTRGSLAEGARLEMLRTPGTAWCMPCSRSVPLAESAGACPVCGSYQVQVTGGTEMRVRELEVE